MSEKVAYLQPGFVTGSRDMHPLADEVVARGLAYDVDIGPPLVNALDDSAATAARINGKLFIGVSAAVLVLPEANRVEPTKQTHEVLAFTPPEPTSESHLVVAALQKTVLHWGRLISGSEDRSALSQLMLSNVVELGKTPVKNYQVVRSVANFSAFAMLQKMYEENRTPSGIVALDKDEFFRNAYSKRQLQSPHPWVEQVRGHHDEALLNPAAILNQVEHGFGSSTGRLTK